MLMNQLTSMTLNKKALFFQHVKTAYSIYIYTYHRKEWEGWYRKYVHEIQVLFITKKKKEWWLTMLWHTILIGLNTIHYMNVSPIAIIIWKQKNVKTWNRFLSTGNIFIWCAGSFKILMYFGYLQSFCFYMYSEVSLQHF